MNIVGNETDKDLRAIFSDLHEGIKTRRTKAENCICKWDKVRNQDLKIVKYYTLMLNPTLTVKEILPL